MKPKFLLTFVVVLFACAYPQKSKFDLNALPPAVKYYYGSTRAISPRMWMLYKHGLPVMANNCFVSEISDLFSYEFPRKQEFWIWGDTTVYFLSQIEVLISYVPPKIKQGNLQISLVDYCLKDDEFCIELRIDGLKMINCRTLWNIQVMTLYKNHQWIYLYDSSPILSTKGLRAIEVAFFIPVDLTGDNLFLFITKDYLSNETKEAVIKL